MKRILTLCIALMTMLRVFALTENVNGIEWTYVLKGDYAEISSGGMSAAISTISTGDIVVPSQLGSYPVKSIGEYAFYHCNLLDSLTIPSSVTNISDNAFNDCYGWLNLTFLGDAPNTGKNIFPTKMGSSFGIKVLKNTYGWNGDYSSTELPEQWNGYKIEYATYTIAFNANGGSGSMTDQEVLYNVTDYIKSNSFARVNFTFQGWSDSSESDVVLYKDCATIKNFCNIDETRTLYAVWAPSSFSVNFNANGGEGKMESQKIVCNTSTRLSENKFTRTGYNFLGWRMSSDAGVVEYKDNYFVENLCEANKSITLYAIWEPISYTVAYNANGGTGTMSNQYIDYDETFTLRSNTFSRAYYTFQGWSTTSNGGVVYSNGVSLKNLLSKEGKITLYAKWKPIQYTIAFNANGGTGTMAKQTVSYDALVTLNVNTFKKTGQSFKGWAKTSDGSVVYKDGASIKNLLSKEGTITLYAIWEPISYTIIFNANGGTGRMLNQTLKYDQWDTLRRNTFKRSGYIFQGWSKTKNGKLAYKDLLKIVNLTTTSSITLYAVWKPISYKVAFNANGGSGKMAAKAMTYGTAVALPKNAFTRSGYVFAGWAKTATGAVAYKNAATVKNLRATSGTVTLYAVWAKPSYSIAFYANGGSGKMAAQAMKYNKAAYLTKNAFKRTGYAFAGWAKTATGAVVYTNGQAVKNLTTSGGTVKLYAKWKPISYKIAYYPNGGEGSVITQAMTYNKAAYLKKNTFKRTGYMFLGWAKRATGAVAYKNAAAVKNLRATSGTVTLYAVWAKTNYKIAFYANGGTGTMAAQVMTYNKAAYLTKNAFKRTGYMFLGWAKTTTGAVAYTNGQAVKNLTKTGATIKLFAKWTPISYKIAFYANGGTGTMSAQAMTYNKAAYLKKNAFKRTGYIFLGWAKTATGAVAYKNVAAVKNLRSTKGTIKLYAVWAKTNYKIAFYANGGTGSMSAQAMTYNKAAYLKKNAFKRTGYTFAGWSKSATGSVVYTDGKAVKNLTTTGATIKLYAVWKKN